MKKPIFLILFLSLFAFSKVSHAQKHPLSIVGDLNSKETQTQTKSLGDQIDFTKIYLDANIGYFPHQDNASWAGAVSGGYRMTEQSAIGLGIGMWGRQQVFKRRALGVGVQYRRTLWERLLAKIEVGYIAQAKMYDTSTQRDMAYQPKSSQPIFYKAELHWRFFNILTLGVSAEQSGNLFFTRSNTDNTSTSDKWRINALNVHIGIALDSDY